MTAGMMYRGQHSLCPEDEAPEPLYVVGDMVVFTHTSGIFKKQTQRLAGRITEREYTNHSFMEGLGCEWFYTITDEYFKWESEIDGIYEE